MIEFNVSRVYFLLDIMQMRAALSDSTAETKTDSTCVRYWGMTGVVEIEIEQDTDLCDQNVRAKMQEKKLDQLNNEGVWIFDMFSQ